MQKPIIIVPPTIETLAAILNHRLDIRGIVARLSIGIDDSSWEYFSLIDGPQGGLQKVKYSCALLRAAITVAITSTTSGTLIWLNQTRCHPLCTIIGAAHCSAPWDQKKMTRKIWEKHTEVVDKVKCMVQS